MANARFYCKGDQTFHYVSELPKSLRGYVLYEFSSGSVVGDDFKSFCTKYKNAVKKLLPDGFSIHKWMPNHYCLSAVIQDTEERLIYLSIPDVRFWDGEWYSNILIRTMETHNDWRGGSNHYTTLFSLTKDLQNLYIGRD